MLNQDIAPAYYIPSADRDIANEALNSNDMSFFLQHPVAFGSFNALQALGLGNYQFLITFCYTDGAYYAGQITLGVNGKMAYRAERSGTWTEWMVINLPTASWGVPGEVAENTGNVQHQYQRYGDICTYIFTGKVYAPNEWSDYKIATGLPPSKFAYSPMGIFQSQSTQKAYIVIVNSSGELYLRSENAPIDSDWMRGSITYVCN